MKTYISGNTYPRLIIQIDSNKSDPSRFNSYYLRSPQESQKTKKADLAPKTNPKPNFESRFGFLVKFYPFPELGFKISGLERKKMNLYPFFAFLDHCVTVRSR